MMKKLLLTAGLAMALAFGLIAGGGTPARANPGGVQDFNLDMANCLLNTYAGTPATDLVSPDPMTGFSQDCKPAEAAGKGVDPAAASMSTSIGLISGNRLGYPYVYNGPGWQVQGMVDSGANTAEIMSATPTDEDAGLAGVQSIVDIDDETLLAGAVGRDVMVESEAMDLVAVTGGTPDTMKVTRPSPAAHAQPLDISRNQIANDTVVGDVASNIDLYQDGSVDWVGDDSNCGGAPNDCGTALSFTTVIPEAYVKETLAWGATTGCDGEDESFLTGVLPGASAMTPLVRYRACIDTVFLLGQYRVNIAALNGADTPLNLVTLSPNWSPAGTHVDLVQLAGEGVSPTTGLLGLDSPQGSLSHTNRPYAANPTAPGLYVRWITEISSEDEANRAINFVYSTSCKKIGVGAFPDGDADCLSTTVNPGSPGVSESTLSCASTDIDGDTVVGDADPDSDGDGLLDGVEVAWGSDPCDADTDDDGRTDAEEMVGPTQLLSDPTDADTDDDGVDDGGLKLDGIDAGMAPDFPDENGDGVIDAGMSANQDASGDGSSHRRVGFKIVGKDIEANGAGMDNCPSAANAGQLNTDYDTSLVFNPNATQLGNGDVYGDDCDSDADQDSFVDVAEANFQYDFGAHQCSNDKDLPGPATPLDPLNPDTDGGGVLDGRECEVGSNPGDINDSPGAQLPDPDKDGVSNAYETARRSQSFSNQPPPATPGSEDVDGDTLIGQQDVDSDFKGGPPYSTLADGCEAYVTGTSLLSTNTDWDLTSDTGETGAAARAAAFCYPNVATYSVQRTVVGVDADDVELTFNLNGSQIVMLWAHETAGGAPTCVHLATPTGPTYTVTWANKCLAKDDTLGIKLTYVGANAPTLATVTWTDPGTPIGSEPGPFSGPTLGSASATDLDGDLVLNDVDNCLFVPNPDQANTNPAIGNGKGVAGDDITVPWSVKTDKRGDACDGDLDNDGIKNGSDPQPGGAGGDITYDDGPAAGGDGTWQGTGDDGPSWDTNMDAKLDGVAACAGSLGAWGSLDSDGDGLQNGWEYCKWSSSPLFGRTDSDGDTVGDCKEVADVDGNNVVNFPGDVIYYAKVGLIAGLCK